MPSDDELRGLLTVGEELSLTETLEQKAGRYRVLEANPDGVRVRDANFQRHFLDWPEAFRRGIGLGSPPPLPNNLDAQQVSVVGAYGYRVGAKGLPAANRRAILMHVFEAPLSELQQRLPRFDTEDWGESATPERLYRIAYRLAQDVRNESDQKQPAAIAIKEWNSDRDWLKTKYYQSSFPFAWPAPYA